MSFPCDLERGQLVMKMYINDFTLSTSPSQCMMSHDEKPLPSSITGSTSWRRTVRGMTSWKCLLETKLIRWVGLWMDEHHVSVFLSHKVVWLDISSSSRLLNSSSVLFVSWDGKTIDICWRCTNIQTGDKFKKNMIKCRKVWRQPAIRTASTASLAMTLQVSGRGLGDTVTNYIKKKKTSVIITKKVQRLILAPE